MSRDGEGLRNGGYAARLDAGGAMTATDSAGQPGGAVVEFELAAVSLGPEATAFVEYFDGASWHLLVRPTGTGRTGGAGLTAHRFWLPHLAILGISACVSA